MQKKNAMSNNKFLITQSLLSAYGWMFKLDNGYEDFMKTLNREPTQANMAMLNGRKFENLVTAYCQGEDINKDHEWHKGIKGIGDIVQGGAFQVRLSKNTIINNVEFILYGILDVLKCGDIHDIKFSKTYRLNKYLDSPQHPMYFSLCPEARRFNYLVSDGYYVYKETYYPDDTEPIETDIKAFMQFLDKHDLVNLYCDKWRSKY